MADRVLCVDDEPNILDAFKRQLRKEFVLVTADGAEQGLEKMTKDGPFAVVLSDLHMPGMGGVEFLAKVRVHDPDCVRMLLTGRAELDTAIDAINEGQIFRFLTKPCASETLAGALRAALAQHSLITAERELLEHTLSGSIKVLCEVLALVNPEAFGRSSRITRSVEAIATNLHVSELWSIKTAALLSQIGCIILPEVVLKKVYQGEVLTDDESELFNQHPFVASDLIAKIPRMQRVAEIIKFQDTCLDESDRRQVGRNAKIPLEAKILKVALDFDALETAGKTKMEAYDEIRRRRGRYDESILDALKTAFAAEIKYDVRTAVLTDLRPGMVIDENIHSSNYVLLCAKGQEVTKSTIYRLTNFVKTMGVRQPFQVLVPIEQDIASSEGELSKKGG